MILWHLTDDHNMNNLKFYEIVNGIFLAFNCYSVFLYDIDSIEFNTKVFSNLTLFKQILDKFSVVFIKFYCSFPRLRLLRNKN